MPCRGRAGPGTGLSFLRKMFNITNARPEAGADRTEENGKKRIQNYDQEETIMRVIYADKNNVLNLGRVGEMPETELRFPVGDTIRSRGEGTFRLLVLRSADGDGAECVPVEGRLVREGEELYFVRTVTEEDLFAPDRGCCMLEYRGADGEADILSWNILDLDGDGRATDGRAGDGGEDAPAGAGVADPEKYAAAGSALARLVRAAFTLPEGYFHPLCVPGTWVYEEEGGEGRSVPAEDPYTARFVDIMFFSCDTVFEVEDGFAVHGYYEDGERIPLSAGRVLIEADRPCALAISARDEETAPPAEDDLAAYETAVRIPTKTAAEVAAVARSLGTVSRSVLTAVSAVSEAQDLLAEQVTGLMNGTFSPFCEEGEWDAPEGAPDGIPVKRENGDRIRSVGFLRFDYDAEVTAAEGVRILCLAEDGTAIVGDPLVVPAGTGFCLTVVPDPERYPAPLTESCAGAVKILSKAAAELAVVRERLDMLDEAAGEASAAVTALEEGVRRVEGFSPADYLKNEGWGVTVPGEAVLGTEIRWRTPVPRENWSWLTVDDVVPGEKFLVTLFGGRTAPPYFWLDARDRLVGKAPALSAANAVITAPENAARLVINYMTALPYAAHRLSTVEGRVAAIEAALRARDAVRRERAAQAGSLRRARFDGQFLSVAHSAVENDPGRSNTAAHFRYCGRQAGFAALRGDVSALRDGLVMSADPGATLTEDGYLDAFDAASFRPWREMGEEEASSLRHAATMDPVILFDEYLRICRRYGKIAFICLRDEFPAEAAARLLETMEKYRMKERCTVSSVRISSLRAVRDADGGVLLSLALAPSEKLTEAAVDAAWALGAAMISAFDFPDYGRDGVLTGEVLSYARKMDVRICDGVLTNAADLDLVEKLGLSGALMTRPA